MNLKLTRVRCVLYGIFGQLSRESGEAVCQTLEHSYVSGEPTRPVYTPKIPVGMYQCIRGKHTPEGHPPLETFEITNVPGHTRILFHRGNVNDDSKGCVLLGTAANSSFLFNSEIAFGDFMGLQEGCDEFTLVVV